MNQRPILAAPGPRSFLERLPLPNGALLSKNPNARRDPLVVDGW